MNLSLTTNAVCKHLGHCIERSQGLPWSLTQISHVCVAIAFVNENQPSSGKMKVFIKWYRAMILNDFEIIFSWYYMSAMLLIESVVTIGPD